LFFARSGGFAKSPTAPAAGKLVKKNAAEPNGTTAAKKPLRREAGRAEMECEDKKSPAERRRIEVDQDVKIKNAAERTNGGSFSNLPSCFRQHDLVQYVPNPSKGCIPPVRLCRCGAGASTERLRPLAF
jgi:hypothetical protein